MKLSSRMVAIGDSLSHLQMATHFLLLLLLLAASSACSSAALMLGLLPTLHSTHSVGQSTSARVSPLKHCPALLVTFGPKTGFKALATYLSNLPPLSH